MIDHCCFWCQIVWSVSCLVTADVDGGPQWSVRCCQPRLEVSQCHLSDLLDWRHLAVLFYTLTLSHLHSLALTHSHSPTSLPPTPTHSPTYTPTHSHTHTGVMWRRELSLTTWMLFFSFWMSSLMEGESTSTSNLELHSHARETSALRPSVYKLPYYIKHINFQVSHLWSLYVQSDYSPSPPGSLLRLTLL